MWWGNGVFEIGWGGGVLEMGWDKSEGVAEEAEVAAATLRIVILHLKVLIDRWGDWLGWWGDGDAVG